jgi:multimeric flavodoxin WrbA
MKITSFNGSPKAKGSNTAVVVSAFLQGAEKAGAEVENVMLCKKEIKHCSGCLNCWIKTPEKCVIKDDMAELIEKYVSSDIVVMATPLYIDNVSGMLKVFMDRLIPTIDPHFVIDENGETTHPKPDKPAPKIMVIATCGFPERSQFQVLELLFRRISRNMHSVLVAEIYRSQGNLLTLEQEMLKPIQEDYLSIVTKAGEEVVKAGRILEATQEALDKDLVPKEMCIDGANRLWDKHIAKIKEKQG